jgi:hypothetical protein
MASITAIAVSSVAKVRTILAKFGPLMVGAGSKKKVTQGSSEQFYIGGITPAQESIRWGRSVCAQLIGAPARQTTSLPSPSRLDLHTDRSVTPM